MAGMLRVGSNPGGPLSLRITQKWLEELRTSVSGLLIPHDDEGQLEQLEHQLTQEAAQMLTDGTDE